MAAALIGAVVLVTQQSAIRFIPETVKTPQVGILPAVIIKNGGNKDEFLFSSHHIARAASLQLSRFEVIANV